MIYNVKTLGILGGGQLGRMSAMAAARLGIRAHIYSPEEDCPARAVSAACFIGAYDDQETLKKFAESVDVITYEFENIPLETIDYLQTLRPVYPDDKLLSISQDRGKEKKFLNDIGIPTTSWALARSPQELEDFIKKHKSQNYILKTTRFGYDGKGQIYLPAGGDTKTSWDDLNTDEIIIEEAVDFTCEISIIIARDQQKQTVTYGPMLNQHISHILAKTIVPAPVSESLAQEACQLAEQLAAQINLIGVLALELFVTKDQRLLANEIAPRPHNSGHWSIDACSVSQFEQHVRTVCGLPVAPPNRHSDAVMTNLIGRDVHNLAPWITMAGANLHLYGKNDIREGRKMGHVTVINPITHDKNLKQKRIK